MERSIKLLFCLLGSVFLALLKCPVFGYAEQALWEGRGYGSSSTGIIFYNIINVISFIGFILIVIFSIALIIVNLNFKDKK
ncbi:hypothetical protein I6U48_13200 [Clostridium sp. PL3]|uniref:Uncharacterized protein n=1 Tax=Clostridium thailandense TaxID=2794346 RepID=A0A949TJ98_9CLOT|nr:hypothetical protein [Clostridium thailandense]MBV7273864.1 hypothetical protein [Clostridium thailandense]